ncbi:MAG: ABC transporter ATP-binding protein [Candidatus Dojkabacteria bacterium]|nr:MAG: ABC transporter ATP-binding protein [Candidatus Dojkabacteria bacterium]
MSTMKKEQRPIMPMGGRPGGMMGGGIVMGAKAKDFKGTLRKLIGYLRPYWGKMIAVVIFAIASTVFTIVSPKILGNITNQIVEDYINITIYTQAREQLPQGMELPPGTKGEVMLKFIPPEQLQQIPEDRLEKLKSLDLTVKPEFRFDVIGQIALWLIGLYLLSAFFSYIQGWIMSGVSQDVTFKLRRDVSQKINRLPLRYFDTNTHGDILSRITNDIDTISQTLNQSMSQLITSIATLIGILIMMFSINWLMTIVALLVLPASLIVTGVIIKKSQKFFTMQSKTLGDMNGHIEEMYGGHTVVKAFNAEARSLEKFTKINKELHNSGWKSQFLSGLLFPVMSFIGNIGYVGIAVLGGKLAIEGRINIGDIQAFIQYLQQFNQPIIQTANIANVLQSLVASSERVFEFIEEAEESTDKAGELDARKIKGEVSFENVTFGYEPEKLIIKGFTANIKPGQTVAIVGPTGAGKTTMVNLLMRFYEVNSGSIKIDGVDISTLKRSNVRKLFGMVLQDTWLFKGTIKENIAYSNPDATLQEIKHAAEMAHVDHFIESLPQGYDTEINESADNISQGEKQLLTITRAMLADSPMLILDEATSSVDTRTEILIQKAMKKLMDGKTSFIIAHRLSTIKEADVILVMNQGNIVEQGTHKKLLQKDGFYSKLYNSQFEE